LFTDVITTVCEKVENSIGFVYGPCMRCTSRVHGPCTRPCRVYTARTQPSTRPRTRPIHDRTRRPCIRLYVHGPYTGVHGSYMAVTRPYTGREGCTTMYTAVYKPCTWSCTRVYGPYMTVDTARVHNRVHGTAVYTARPCTRACRIHGTCTRPCTDHVQ